MEAWNARFKNYSIQYLQYIISPLRIYQIQMASYQQSHESLTQSAGLHPHLLSKITQKYLHFLASTSNNPNTISWERMEVIMEQLNDEETSIEKCLLLLNVTKLIVSSTFTDVSNFRQNKIYCWLGMLYGVKCNQIICRIQKNYKEITQNARHIQVESQKKEEMLKNICYGLLMSQIAISLIENTNRKNTTNKVIYPEFYRFINLILESIRAIGPISIHRQVKYEHQQPTNEMEEEVQQKSHTIKTTSILKMMCQKNKQKSNKKIKKYANIDFDEVNILILAKAVSLLVRSFQLCKIKALKNIHIIKNQINTHLQSIVKSNQEPATTQTHPSLKLIILDYLTLFQEPKDSQCTENPYDQIDEQNKIIQVKELTPRFLDEDPQNEVKKLRTKKKKLIKKIESDARSAKFNRLQQRKVLEDVRNERVMKRQKKQLFVMQKQTEQAKKAHKKTKKIKQIQKQPKGSSKKSKPGKR